MDSLREKFKVVGWVAAILAIGTAGYYVLEDDWSVLDAFYMAFITITPVGSGEIQRLSPVGRIFTVGLMMVGLGAIAMFASQFARFIIAGELKGFLGRKSMQEKIRKLNRHYIVCGYGNLSDTICLKLHDLEIPFVIIEPDEMQRDLAQQRGYLTISGNATADATLQAAGIARAAGIVTGITDDAANLSIALAAREMNPNIYIVALGSDPKIERRFLRAGADTVVYPVKLGGEQIARLIARQTGTALPDASGTHDPGVMGYYLRVFRHFNESAVTIGEAVAGIKASAAVALHTADGQRIESPAADISITKHDTVVMLVNRADAAAPQPEHQTTHLAWSEEFELGIDAMDDEHRQLVQLVNEFQQALSAGHGGDAMATVFDSLLEYTVEHFQHEERIMAKAGYPATDIHKKRHRELTQQVMALNKDKRYVFPENVGDFLSHWLTDHIMGTDRELAKFLHHHDYVGT